jgi:hypothetical protein
VASGQFCDRDELSRPLLHSPLLTQGGVHHGPPVNSGPPFNQHGIPYNRRRHGSSEDDTLIRGEYRALTADDLLDNSPRFGSQIHQHYSDSSLSDAESENLSEVDTINFRPNLKSFFGF